MPEPPHLRVVLLGTGTLQPESTRTSPAHYVEGPGFRALMDCGAETAVSLSKWGLPWKDITHLLLTHFHTDHVGGLPALFWALKHGAGNGAAQPYEAALTVLGPPGVVTLFERLAGAFGAFMEEPGRDLIVVELKRRDRWEERNGAFDVETRPAKHTERSVSFRIVCSEGAVGYTGDTGPSEAVAGSLGDADIGISECARPDPMSDPGHLTPSTLAELLRATPPELLITTHAYPPLDPETVPDLMRAQGYTGRVMAGYDGMDVRVVNGQVDVVSTGNNAE